MTVLGWLAEIVGSPEAVGSRELILTYPTTRMAHRQGGAAMGLDEVTTTIAAEYRPIVATGIDARTSDEEVAVPRTTGGETGRGRESGTFIVDREDF